MILDESLVDDIEAPQARNRLCFSETFVPDTVSFRVRAVPIRNLRFCPVVPPGTGNTRLFYLSRNAEYINIRKQDKVTIV